MEVDLSITFGADIGTGCVLNTRIQKSKIRERCINPITRIFKMLHLSSERFRPYSPAFIKCHILTAFQNVYLSIWNLFLNMLWGCCFFICFLLHLYEDLLDIFIQFYFIWPQTRSYLYRVPL